MNGPIAYFLTITTYGTWLPGDQRGWTEHHGGFQLPDLRKQVNSQLRMKEGACVLDRIERGLVERQVAETCGVRGWTLYAVSCRSNHLHAVIGASEVSALKVRTDIKAWCTRCLKDRSARRNRWWTDRGSTRWIFKEKDLEAVIVYVLEAQERKDRDV